MVTTQAQLDQVITALGTVITNIQAAMQDEDNGIAQIIALVQKLAAEIASGSSPEDLTTEANALTSMASSLSANLTDSASQASAIQAAIKAATPIPPSAPAITSPLTASGTNGTAFSYQIAASGDPTSFNASPLPAGLSVDTIKGIISGTLPATGTLSITITATNGAGTGSATLVVTVS